MTNMRRVTVCLPESVDKGILSLRKTDEYVNCTYGEIVRRLLVKGLEEFEEKEKAHA